MATLCVLTSLLRAKSRKSYMAERKRKQKLTCFDQGLVSLGRRSMSVKELTEKLTTKNYEEEEIKETIIRLLDFGYLNDEKFARDRIRSRAELTGWGKQRIVMELRKKGVASTIIEKAMENWEDDEEGADAGLFAEIKQNNWQENASDILMRKFGKWPEDLPLSLDSSMEWEIKQDKMKLIQKEKTRRLNFLIRRGFSFEEAQNALNESM